jgi:glycosyltransferase involved in cell wall biosynthesis
MLVKPARSATGTGAFPSSHPIISVVTPSYNQADFLEETILSVLSQSYPNIEYIVMDGGSTDGSIEIIKRYSDRLDYWCSQPDNGQAEAIRRGFERATGDILCWLNSDDIFVPGALENVARFFEKHPSAEVLSAGAVIIDQAGEVFSVGKCVYSMGTRASLRRFLYFGQAGVPQCSTFWRRTAYREVDGIDPSFDFAMDLDLFTRLARRRTFSALRKIVACYRIHPAAKSSTIKHVHNAELSRLQDHYNVSDRWSRPIWRLWYSFTFRLHRLFLIFLWKVRKFVGRPLFEPLVYRAMPATGKSVPSSTSA